MEFKWIKYGVKFVACCGVAWLCYACSTQATISGVEKSEIVLTNAYSQVRYDGVSVDDCSFVNNSVSGASVSQCEGGGFGLWLWWWFCFRCCTCWDFWGFSTQI